MIDINVKWFGAKGDGVTDDTAAIAAAIAKAAASSINGGVVEFPEGTFNHTGIVAVSNVILKGAGSDKTKLSYVGTGSAVSKGAVVTSIFRFGMRDIAVVQDTDGQGGTGLDLDSFQYADFYNVTVSTFRNAGDTGIGVRMVNTHAVCAFNRFVNCTIENCDTALLQDSTNATFATGFSYFAGLTIYQEHNCVQLKNTLAGGGSYNVFTGLQIQGNGVNAGTGKVIYIEGVGNAFYGVQVDAPGTGNILEFNKAATSGNIVNFIGGFDPAKYLNNQSSGAANQVQIPGYFSYSPGKKFLISDPIGQLDVNFQSAGSDGLDIQLGNQTAGASAWRIQMQASATPELKLATSAATIAIWKSTYHKFHISSLEKMRLVAGGLVVEPGNVSNDPDAAAAFEVRSTTKGTMPCPVMTKAQRDAIAAPPNGLTVYQTDGTAGLKCRVAGAWVSLNTTADP